MGDPKKIRKKYESPSHPWEKNRIEEEKGLMKEFGLRSKREIWKMKTFLRNFKHQVKKLVTMTGKQAELEKEQLRNKLLSLGLLEGNSPLDTVSGLTTKNILERRLQTVVFKKNLSKTMKQARQFITHQHVTVDGKKMTSPSYLVKVKEETLISFLPKSTLSDPNHPERYSEPPKTKIVKKKVEKKPKKKEEEKEEVVAFDKVPTEEEVVIGDIKKEEEKEESQEEVKKEEPKEGTKTKEVKETQSSKAASVTESKDSGTQKPKVSVAPKGKLLSETKESEEKEK